MTTKNIWKVLRFVPFFAVLFSLLLNMVFPFPQIANASESLNSTITFNSAKHSFEIGVNTPKTVDYVLAYKTDTQVEGAQGSGKGENGSNFSKEIYAGTCSTNGVCVPHVVLRGILKAHVENSDWFNVKEFTLDKDNLQVVLDSNTTQVDLTDAETAWLDNPNLSPTTSPSVVPTPTPTGAILDGISTSRKAGHLETDVIDNTNASSLKKYIQDSNLSASTLQTAGPSILTDKADYAPTDAAVITGTGFDKKTDLIIHITSVNGYSFDAKVTTDNKGDFVYVYQLDGTYRPTYTVQVKDMSGNVLVTYNFTDSPPSGCSNDAEGANDEPGQKDLTKLCADYAGLPSSLGITWNWDEIGWTGSNTGDACGLFDTNNNGLADYAVCVQVHNTPATYDSMYLYSCGDTKSDRCTSSVSQTPSGGTSCLASVQSTDPFSVDDNYPKDTVASCTINTADVGGTSSTLLDVCSYPSSQPNSDPSDCIVASTASQTGTLTVVKSLNPANDPGLFNLKIDTNIYATDIGNNGTTGPKIVDAGNHSVSETAGTNTSLNNYTSSISCTDGGNVIASGNGPGPLTVNVVNNHTVICTITNTTNLGTLIVHKTFTDSHSNSGITINANPGSLSQLTNNSGDATFSSLSAGSYTAHATEPAGYFESANTCINVSVVGSQTANCIITDSPILGTITVHKTIVGGTATPSEFCFTLNPDPGIGAKCADNITANAVFNNVPAGTYNANETTLASGYTQTSNNCSSLIISSNGDSQSCTITNTRDTGSILIHKLIDIDGNGTFETGDTGANSIGFRWALDNETPARNMGTSATGVNTGSHTATENSVTNYHLVGWFTTGSTQFSCANPEGTSIPVSISVSKDTTTNITFCNARDTGTIKVIKNVSPHDNSLWDITFSGTATGSATLADGGSVGPTTYPTGSYAIDETGHTGTNSTDYTSTYSCVNGQTQVTSGSGTHISFTLSTSQNIVCTFTNTRNTGTVLVNKLVDTDGNGTFETGDAGANTLGFRWALDNESLARDMGTSATGVNTGSHTATENSVTNYHLVGWFTTGSTQFSCANPEGTTNPVTISVTKDATTGITFCNARDTGTIKVIKNVSPHDNSQWDITISGTATGSATLADGGSVGPTTYPTGSYAIDEAGHTGTTTSNYTSTYSCLNGEKSITSGTGTHIAFDLATSQNIVCTFTNTIKRGSITVTKVTDPSQSTQSFTFNLGGSATDSASLTDGQSHSFDNLLPADYTLTEPASSGWDLTNISCDNDITLANGGTIHLTPAENVNCTFTNTQKGHLVVQKTTLPAADLTVFTIEATGSGTITNGGSGTVTDANDKDYEVTPGTYSVTETVPAGWDKTADTCQDVSVPAGQTVYCQLENTERGKVVVTKYLDDNANGKKDEGEQTLSDWTMHLTDQTDQTTGADGTATFNNLTPGPYTLSETIQEGWIQSSITCDTDNRVFDQLINLSFLETDGNSHNITLLPGQTVNCYVGNYQKANITVIKRVVGPNNEDVTDTSAAFGFNISNGPTSVIPFTLTDDQSQPNSVDPGTYDVTETPDQHYDFAGCQAVYEGKSIGISLETGETVIVNSGDSVTVTCTNKQKQAHITLNKNVIDNNGVDISDDTPFDVVGTNGTGTNTISESSPANLAVNPGTYTFTENSVTGYSLDSITGDDDSIPSNGVTFNVASDATASATFVNKQHPAPVLEISKSNNKYPVDQAPGAQVTYTITVTASESAVLDTYVTDLLPQGFVYQGGSWTAYSNIRHDLKALNITTEPTYHSPGTWNLGDLVPGEVVTLTYVATISNSIAQGLYKDVAWSEGASETDDQVLAQAQPTGFVDENFVGTQVNVITNPTQTTASIDVVKNVTGEVLGASTSLPATGSNTIWMVIGALLLFFGSVSVVFGQILKNKKNLFKFKFMKYSIVFMLLVVAGLFTSTHSVEAASPLSIRIEQPRSPTNTATFNIVFVTLDIQGRPITVRCYKKGPSDAGFSQFGSDIAVSAGGNTGNCAVTSGIVSAAGTYQFYATAQAGSDTSTSTIDTVDFNTSSGPGTPSNYSRSAINSCQNRINFKTADDGGKTVKVELYRSTDTSFNLDDGTRVGTLNIGSNQDGSFVDVVPDCSRTYYYALRAFDSLGNGSGVVGDSVIHTTTTTTTTSTSSSSSSSTGAIPVSNVTIPAGGNAQGGVSGGTGETGQTLGAETTAENATGEGKTISTTPGEVKAAETGTENNTTPSHNLLTTANAAKAILVLAILAVAYFVMRKFRK